MSGLCFYKEIKVNIMGSSTMSLPFVSILNAKILPVILLGSLLGEISRESNFSVSIKL